MNTDSVYEFQRGGVNNGELGILWVAEGVRHRVQSLFTPSREYSLDPLAGV